MLGPQSHHIEDILASNAQYAQRASMLLDRYVALNSDEARDEFVAALIHKTLVLQARLSGDRNLK
jgi:hypothetical protein